MANLKCPYLGPSLSVARGELEVASPAVVGLVVARVVGLLVAVAGDAVVMAKSVSLPVMQNSRSAKFCRNMFQSCRLRRGKHLGQSRSIK